MIRCECGRPVRVIPVGKRHSKKARARQPYAIKNHDLCQKCWRAQHDRQRRHPERETDPMLDVFDEINRFDAEVRPVFGPKPGLDILPDGGYDFEILGLAPDRVGQDRRAILRLGLRVLSGPQAGTVCEHTYWLDSLEKVERLSGDLKLLGFDTDQWKPPGRPFSQEIQKAIPRLAGLKFRGFKKANAGQNGKIYQNLTISGRISSSSSSPPPSQPVSAPVAQTATHEAPDSDDFPF